MNNERNRRIRNAGILTTAGLVVAMVGAGCSSEVKPSNTPTPSTIELATPGTSAAGASPSPEVLASPEASASAVKGFVLETGKVIEVNPGDIFSGDFSLNDTNDSKTTFPMYDQDGNAQPGVTDVSKTFVVGIVKTHGFLFADNTGYVVQGLPMDQAQTTVDLWYTAKIRSGAFPQGGAEVEWTGKATSKDQAGKGINDLPGASTAPDMSSPTPSGSPEPSSSPDINGGIGTVESNKALVLLEELQAAEKAGKIDLSDPNIKLLVDELIKCVCVTSCSPIVPIIPSPVKPTPSETPSAACPEDDHQMNKGDFYTLPTGFRAIVLGDVTIDGKKDNKGNVVGGIVAHDNLAGTRAIDQLLDGKSHTIFSPFGGTDVQVFCPTATKDTIAQWEEGDRTKSADKRPIDKKSLIIKWANN